MRRWLHPSPAARQRAFDGEFAVQVDLQQLKDEIVPIAEVHGVELVALEWALGPGRGILRLFIDRHGGDPRTPPESREAGATADLCAAVSRDVGAALDTKDLIHWPYDLEVSSPGFERPVQKREDYDRFAGLKVKVRTRVPVQGKGTFEGTLRGTTDDPQGGFVVKLEVHGKEMELPSREIARSRLAEIKEPPRAKPGKGPKKPKAAPAETAHHTESERADDGTNETTTPTRTTPAPTVER